MASKVENGVYMLLHGSGIGLGMTGPFSYDEACKEAEKINLERPIHRAFIVNGTLFSPQPDAKPYGVAVT